MKPETVLAWIGCELSARAWERVSQYSHSANGLALTFDERRLSFRCELHEPYSGEVTVVVYEEGTDPVPVAPARWPQAGRAVCRHLGLLSADEDEGNEGTDTPPSPTAPRPPRLIERSS